MPRSSSLATSRWLAIATAAGLAACGDPLADADYQGLPLMELSGQVLLEEALQGVEGQVRVAVYWSSQQEEHGIQHQQETEVGTSFPALYSLKLYTPPPDEVFYQPRHAPHAMALGVPIVYDDVDLDGAFDEGEPVLGGAQATLVLYTGESLEQQLPPDGEGGGGGGGGSGREDDTGQGGGGPGSDDDTGQPAQEGALFGVGYHAVSPRGDACEDGFLHIESVDSTTVEMVVGDDWSSLLDMDCDGDTEEWGEL